MLIVYGPHDKVSYTIRNFTTDKDHLADVTHLWPFFYDPKFMTPLNVAALFLTPITNDIVSPMDARWRGRNLGALWNIKGFDVEAFHIFCAANGMHTIFEKSPSIRRLEHTLIRALINDRPLCLTSSMMYPKNGCRENEAIHQSHNTQSDTHYNTVYQATPKQRRR